MAEYIDKQLLIRILLAKSDVAIDDAKKTLYANMARMVERLPPENVASVVRCMDCEFYDDHYCFANQHGAHEDGFCDEGRKKEWLSSRK